MREGLGTRDYTAPAPPHLDSSSSTFRSLPAVTVLVSVDSDPSVVGSGSSLRPLAYFKIQKRRKKILLHSCLRRKLWSWLNLTLLFNQRTLGTLHQSLKPSWESHFNRSPSEEEKKKILGDFPKPACDAVQVSRLDGQLKEHLKNKGKDPHYGSEKTLYKLQESLLDVTGPLTCLWGDLLNKDAKVSAEGILLLVQRALVLPHMQCPKSIGRWPRPR